jgi:hypothetical protein
MRPSHYSNLEQTLSVSLEFYGVSWAKIAAAIGSRDRRLFSTILKKTEPYFEEVFDDEDFEGGPDFELGLERWVEGEIEPAGDGEPALILNLGDALGFVALTRFYGQFVGTVTHSISSGTLFREQFLLGAAQRHLKPPYSLERLLSRPILGYESDAFPFWGGLSKAELSVLAASVSGDAPGDEDPDVDVWLADLWVGLKGGLDVGDDLLTLYA